MFSRRLGNLLRRIFAPRAKRTGRAPHGPTQPPHRQATEPEIDEAVDESFPASDPPALQLEKDR